jgi:hypothetical protein
MKRRVTVTLLPPGPMREIVALDQHGALGQVLHQAAAGALRQPLLSGSASYELAAETLRLAEEAERRRAVRRAQEAAQNAELRGNNADGSQEQY